MYDGIGVTIQKQRGRKDKLRVVFLERLRVVKVFGFPTNSKILINLQCLAALIYSWYLDIKRNYFTND